MSDKITFVVDDGALRVGDLHKFNGEGVDNEVVYRITRAWMNADGKPEYEAERVSLNRHELRKRFATVERKRFATVERK